MVLKYYLDTSIWMYIFENRKGFKNEPLGEYGMKLIFKILSNQNMIAISDIVIFELEKFYNYNQLINMMKPFIKQTEVVRFTQKQRREAIKISKEMNIPKGDVLHAIIARDNNFIMISRDRHFEKLSFIIKAYKPEEFI